jgi:hypothetical protein
MGVGERPGDVVVALSSGRSRRRENNDDVSLTRGWLFRHCDAIQTGSSSAAAAADELHAVDQTDADFNTAASAARSRTFHATQREKTGVHRLAALRAAC